MEINLDKSTSTQALIKIKVNESDYQQLVEKKIKDYAKKASIKGFRPGKVPMGMIRKMYGKSILVEEVNQLVSQNLSDHISKNELRVLGNPLLNEEKTAPIDWDTQKEFEFHFDIGLVEDFEVSVDKKLKVTKHNIKVSSETLKESMEDVRDRFGTEITGDKVEKKDSLKIEISHELIEGGVQEVPVKLSDIDDSASKKFHGKKVGDTVKVDLEKLFPGKVNETLGITAEEEVKGKAEVKIVEITRTEPAEINQELFDKTFGEGKVTSEKEFNDKIKETIAENYDKESDYLLNVSIRKQLLKNTTVELPDEMLKRNLKQNDEKITDEIIEKEFDKYKEQLTWDLIRGKLVKEMEIKVDNDVIKKAALKKIVGDMVIPEAMAEQMDQMVNNYLSQNDGQNYNNVYEEEMENVLFSKLKETINISEKNVSLEDFTKIAEKEMK